MIGIFANSGSPPLLLSANQATRSTRIKQVEPRSDAVIGSRTATHTGDADACAQSGVAGNYDIIFFVYRLWFIDRIKI